MLQNECLVVKIGIDTAENEPSEVWPASLPRTPPSPWVEERALDYHPSGRASGSGRRRAAGVRQVITVARHAQKTGADSGVCKPQIQAQELLPPQGFRAYILFKQIFFTKIYRKNSATFFSAIFLQSEN